MKYRAEIDGLRALAVLPVILFHAGFELFGGGFVGVDVFFVISGYLITSILIEDIENGRFSIIKFYERRARRILPALFFVMLCCIPFAWMWMVPSQLEEFSKSLVAVSLFVSNVLFWRESGYFAAAAEEKPLLHTWSLAVEEQYYLLFPLFLFAVWWFGRNRVFWMIAGLAAVSLVLSEWGWRNNASANFYLAPTRAWELFAGSLAAFVVQRRGVRKSEVLSLVGLAAVLFAIFAYDETVPFPSVYALVPVAGVVLLVLFAEKDTLTARLLSTRVFVGTGLISYSAYLWHQPLFAFARIRSFEPPGDLTMLVLSATSIVLAVFSWKYVEQPFRQAGGLMTRRASVFLSSALGMAAFLSLGLLGYTKDGFTSRMEAGYLKREAHMLSVSDERQAQIRAGICHFNGRGEHGELEDFLKHWECRTTTPPTSGAARFAVYGDSHSADKAVALRLNGANVTQLGGSGCPLIPQSYGVPGYCDALLEKFVEEVAVQNYDYILLANRFNDDKRSKDYLQRIVDYWSRFDTRVVLFTPMPEFPKFDRVYAVEPYSAETMQYDQQMLQGFDENLKHVVLTQNIRIVDTESLFCSIGDESCSPLYQGDVLLADYGHLSLNGARLFGKKLIEELGRIE